jgi:hypothetical protein
MAEPDKPNDQKELDKIFEELEGRSDRGVIIVGAALLEEVLEDCIASRLLRQKNNKEKEELFGERGCFSTFALKINGAYFLRIIGPETKKNFHLVRKIRNEAAHRSHKISFVEAQKIKDLCRELKFAKAPFGKETEKPLDPDLRRAFRATVVLFGAALALRAREV